MASSEIPVIGPVLSKVFGNRNERIVKRYTTRVDAIGALEAETRQLTDEQLRAKLEEFRTRHDDGAKPDDLLVEVFAVAREVMDRAVGIRNIFNPNAGFDPSVLSAEGQQLFAEYKAKIDAIEPSPTAG